MEHDGDQVLAYTDLFKCLDDDEHISVKAGDLKEFLRQLSMGAIEPGLSLHSQAQRTGGSDEAFCSVIWCRDDIVSACEHVYGIELDRSADGVEEMIDDVLSKIGGRLQERSTEFGYELIYDFLPDRELVESLAQTETVGEMADHDLFVPAQEYCVRPHALGGAPPPSPASVAEVAKAVAGSHELESRRTSPSMGL